MAYEPIKNIHKGHRERLRSKIQKYPSKYFNDQEMLEYILYPIIPRRDTSPLAYQLINRFGSLANVLGANVDELIEEGLSEKTAAYISYINYFVSFNLDTILNCEISSNRFVDELAKLMRASEKDRDDENMFICIKDSYGHISAYKWIKNNENKIFESLRLVINTAIKFSAGYIAIATFSHDGSCCPTAWESFITSVYAQELKNYEILLLDRYILSDNHIFSFSEMGLLFEDPKSFSESGKYSIREILDCQKRL